VLVLLNNDTEVQTPDWLEAMLEYSLCPDVGAVGAQLLYRDGESQHEGIVVGVGGFALNAVLPAGHPLKNVARECSAVTAACLMTRKSVFNELGGLDEGLAVAWNDVDFCLRARANGYRTIFTPHARLYHAEGASRGKWQPAEDDITIKKRWGAVGSLVDPYYNPNLDTVHLYALR